MRCPDDNTLVALVEQALPSTHVGELEVHLDSCPSCRQVLAALAGGSGSLAAGTPPDDWRAVLDDADALIGTTVNERYEITSLLGRGGMGTVYRARDLTLGREVALKLHRAGSDDAARRLLREATAMAMLSHPNIVTVYETARLADRVYIAMEYVRGTTLRGWLAERARPWRDIVRMLVEIGRGLAAAHAAGLVHRDFKPENVLVGSDGRARVGDFGLARVGAVAGAWELPSAATVAASMTVTGTVLGTPAYMAPEQLAGATVDTSADQFTFCVVAWECLFGSRPFTGDTLAALKEAFESGLPRPPRTRDGAERVPARVVAVLGRGLARDPSARYESVDALIADLRIAARPRTRRWIAVGVAASAAIVTATVAVRSSVVETRRIEACTAAGDEVRAVLGQQARSRIEAAITASGSPMAPASYERTVAALDQYAKLLAQRTTAACVDRNEAPPIAAARKACLVEHRSELQTLLGQLSQPDPGLALRAPGAAWAIIEPNPCADTAALLAHRAAPSIAPELQAPLERVRVLKATGDYAAARETAATLLEAAKTASDRFVELQALLELGEAHLELGEVEPANTNLHAALTLAERHGEQRDAIAALTMLATVAASVSQDYDAAHRYLDVARAKTERTRDNLSLRGRVLSIEAQLLMEELKLEPSERAAREAVAALIEVYGPDHPNVGAALGTHSQVLGGLDRKPEALEAGRRSLDILARALGPSHPTVAGARMTVATHLISTQSFDEARGLLRAADDAFVRSLGEGHPVRASVHGVLCDLERAAADTDASIAACRVAVTLLEQHQGAGTPHALGARHDLVRSLTAADRIEEAETEIGKVLAGATALGATGEARLMIASIDAAELALRRHQPARAIEHAERAVRLAIDPPATAEPEVLASARFVLARALIAANKSPVRALTLARDALAGADPGQRDTITSWLALNAPR